MKISLSPEELKASSQIHGEITGRLDMRYYWIESYITSTNIYCILMAENEEMVREHSNLGKFPLTNISGLMASFEQESPVS